jgi:hypothetical protein
MSKPDLTDGDPSSPIIKDRPIMSGDAYDIYMRRSRHVRVRKGGGPGCPALLSYDLLRSDIKQKIFEKYGNVKEANKRNKIMELIEPDFKASDFFANYQFEDETGIKPERQMEYNANAMVLNAIGRFVSNTTSRQKAMGNKTTRIWQVVSEAVNALDSKAYPHTLPSHPLRLKEKYKNYQDHGYFQLIHKGTGNANAKKVTSNVENLIMSIYCMANLPFGSWVHEDYLSFVSGNKTIVDKESGEILDREDYFDDKHGSYISISRGTVWNILHEPVNANLCDRIRNNRIDHVTQHTPFNHRRPPEFSLSKISADDRTFSRKTEDGKRFNAYVVFDVLSDVVLGAVQSVDAPSVGMIWDCFRDMYSTINKNNLVWPGELECENHLMKDIEVEIRNMFTHVTFCAPGLSRSKRAEHKIRSKKYGDEKRFQEGIGRWNQKGAYKTKSENKDEDYKEPRIPIKRLITEELESIHRFNHSPHPKQKMFPGKTRWQVLIENMNPDLGPPQKFKLFKYLGIRVPTSIRNNDFCQVMYEKYSIDRQDSISRIKPNNYCVEAYYVPDHDGNIPEVFIYQGDTFITKATKIERYNEAKIERTEKDEQIRTDQAKRQAHFFKVEKEGIEEKITRKLEIIPSDSLELPEETILVPEPELPQEESLEELTKHYSSLNMKSRAIDEL